MFESKLFNQWLEEIKEKRIKDLLEVKEMVNTFKLARKEQATYEVCGYDPIERIQSESDEQYKNWIINKYKDHKYHVIPEMKNCCCWDTTKKINRYEKTDNVIITEIIVIDGNEYENYLYSTGCMSYYADKKRYNGLEAYLSTRGHSLSDANLIDGRDNAWIIKRAEKENENLRKALIAKVSKICGEDIVEVRETSELYLKGANGRTAKLWAISAGGYNVQCLHTRVLVKEVNA